MVQSFQSPIQLERQVHHLQSIDDIIDAFKEISLLDKIFLDGSLDNSRESFEKVVHQMGKKFTIENGIYEFQVTPDFRESPSIFEKKMRFMDLDPDILYCHDYIVAIYILQGQYDQAINSKVLPLKAGDLMIVYPDAMQSFPYLDEETLVVNTLLTEESFDKIFRELSKDSKASTPFLTSSLYAQGGRCHYTKFSVDPGSFLDQLIQKILIEDYSKNLRSTTTLQALFTVIFAYLSREFANIQRNWKGLDHDREAEKNQLLAYLDEHIANWTLTDMARHFHFHPAYLSSLAKTYFGTNFNEILIQKRMEETARLLAESSNTIDSIIEDVGYSNKTYFYRLFKKHYQMTPGQYRSANRQK